MRVSTIFGRFWKSVICAIFFYQCWFWPFSVIYLILVKNDNQNELALFKEYSTNHYFSKSPKYGGNTKKVDFTIDNLTALKKKHTQFPTVCCYKNVECHIFVATTLGLASELKLVVVKIRFGCGFWFNWTLAFRKKLLPECIPSTQIFRMTREAEVENVENLLFCIRELWTENIKKFVTNENDFVPNECTVKNCEYYLCMISLSDPPL